MRRTQLAGIIILFIVALYLAVVIVPEDHPLGNYRIKATIDINGEKVNVELITRLAENDGMLIQNTTTYTIGEFNYSLNIMGLDSYARRVGNKFWAYVRLTIENRTINISSEQVSGEILGPDTKSETMNIIGENGRIRLEKTIRVNVRFAFYVFLFIIVIWAIFALNPLIIALAVPVLAILVVNIPPYDVLSVFWDPAIALIFGAFVIAYSMDKSGLAKRLSYIIVSKAKSPRKLLFYMAFTSFFLSMWMSSLATMLVMLPIISTILKAFNASEKSGYAQGITLATIFGSVLGGMTTLVGNPANALAASIAYRTLGARVEFIDWIMYALPLSIMIMIVVIMILAIIYDIKKDIREQLIRFDETSFLAFEAHLMGMGPLTRDEKITLLVLVSVIVSWIISSILSSMGYVCYLNLSAISLAGALVLMATNVFTTDDLKEIRWDVLLVLGGSLSLAVLMKESGILDIFMVELMALSLVKIIVLIIPMLIVLSLILGALVSIAIILPLLQYSLILNPGFLIYMTLISTAIIFGPNGVVLEEHARGRGFLRYSSFVKMSIVYMVIALALLIPSAFIFVLL